MIEAVFAPALFVVAILAFHTEPSFMTVIMGMTRIAIRLDLDLIRILLMTGFTSYITVPAT
jgi:hypothetical protein